ncbi:hypothetical protein I4U23_001617 [Adineta vaga]|nr:hypothetical protein I4U23_001617 [Adineta vaga]
MKPSTSDQQTTSFVLSSTPPQVDTAENTDNEPASSTAFIDFTSITPIDAEQSSESTSTNTAIESSTTGEQSTPISPIIITSTETTDNQSITVDQSNASNLPDNISTISTNDTEQTGTSYDLTEGITTINQDTTSYLIDDTSTGSVTETYTMEVQTNKTSNSESLTSMSSIESSNYGTSSPIGNMSTSITSTAHINLSSTSVDSETETTQYNVQTTTSKKPSPSGPACYSPSSLTAAHFILSLNEMNVTYSATYFENLLPNVQPCFFPGVVGETSAIRLLSAMKQYVSIIYPFDFRQTSFTISTWIYLYSYPLEMTILSQCSNQEQSQCLSVRIARNKMLFSFFGSNTIGNTKLQLKHWHHVAFVYSYHSQTQLIYLDGVFNGRGSGEIYLGDQYNITIGGISDIAETYFDGLIDQILLINRAMSANEVLKEASLCAYYPFNNSTELDPGPNRIKCTATNVLLTDGVFHKSLLLSAINYLSYFQAHRFFLLGVSQHSYAFSCWIRLSQTHNSGSIVYATSDNRWCSPMLGFNRHGQIVAQSSDGMIREIIGRNLLINTWAHIALTYEYGQYLHLYQDGLLIDKTGPFNYAINGLPVALTLGFLNHQADCHTQSIVPGPFNGAIDDFQVYSRHLSDIDIRQIMQIPGTIMHSFNN